MYFRVQFGDKFSSAYYTKLLEKSCYSYHCFITESRDKRNFDSAHAIAICMHSCYNYAFVLHKNAHILSQSDARIFLRVLL